VDGAREAKSLIVSERDSFFSFLVYVLSALAPCLVIDEIAYDIRFHPLPLLTAHPLSRVHNLWLNLHLDITPIFYHLRFPRPLPLFMTTTPSSRSSRFGIVSLPYWWSCHVYQLQYMIWMIEEEVYTPLVRLKSCISTQAGDVTNWWFRGILKWFVKIRFQPAMASSQFIDVYIHHLYPASTLYRDKQAQK
jgi:hypothetical protein